MFKQFVKKVIHKLKHESVEVVKDSAVQLGKAVSPVELIKQATGSQNSSEMTDYLKKLGDESLTGEALEKRKEEIAKSDEDNKAKLRLFLNATPQHLKTAPGPTPERAYDVTIADMERKKAQEAEAQKQQPLVSPTSKQTRGMMGKKRPKTADFEAKLNIKAG